MHDSNGSNSTHLLLEQALDAEQKQSELHLLRALNQKLTSELFQTCCEIQRNPSSLNPLRLSALVFSLEMISSRLRRVEDCTTEVHDDSIFELLGG